MHAVKNNPNQTSSIKSLIEATWEETNKAIDALSKDENLNKIILNPNYVGQNTTQFWITVHNDSGDTKLALWLTRHKPEIGTEGPIVPDVKGAGANVLAIVAPDHAQRQGWQIMWPTSVQHTDFSASLGITFSWTTPRKLVRTFVAEK